MSGIYIPGMEMPTSCWDCEVGNAKQMDNATCPFYSMEYLEQENYQDKIADGCPLVPVPEHGDLIDRDALRESIRESVEECHKWADEVDKDTMMYARISQSLGTFVECSLRAKAAPTIIPADKEAGE